MGTWRACSWYIIADDSEDGVGREVLDGESGLRRYIVLFLPGLKPQPYRT